MSVVLGSQISKKIDPNKSIYTGSSLDRKPQNKTYKKKEKSEPKSRTMSSRTRTKVRSKLIAFAQQHKRLTFVTFTFVNQVDDETGIMILRKFLDNMKKRKRKFEYLWVAERQTNNEVFKDNIHFHMITNAWFEAKPTCKYWIDLQKRNGIKPRRKEFNPSSAFDVKSVSTKNPKHLGMYLTKYVTKNKAEFNCQVWNCSKKVSQLYTGFYSSMNFLDQLRRVKGYDIKEVSKEYCTLHFIPFDKTTFRFYDELKRVNNDMVFAEVKK